MNLKLLAFTGCSKTSRPASPTAIASRLRESVQTLGEFVAAREFEPTSLHVQEIQPSLRITLGRSPPATPFGTSAAIAGFLAQAFRQHTTPRISTVPGRMVLCYLAFDERRVEKQTCDTKSRQSRCRSRANNKIRQAGQAIGMKGRTLDRRHRVALAIAEGDPRSR